MCILIPDLPKIPVIESRVFNQLFRPVHPQPEPYPRLMLLKRLDDLCRLFSPFSRQTEFPAPSVLFRNFQFQPPLVCQGFDNGMHSLLWNRKTPANVLLEHRFFSFCNRKDYQQLIKRESPSSCPGFIQLARFHPYRIVPSA